MHNDWLYLFGGVNELGASTVSLFKAQISRTAMDRAGALHAAAAGTGLGGGTYSWQQQDLTCCVLSVRPVLLHVTCQYLPVEGWHHDPVCCLYHVV